MRTNQSRNTATLVHRDAPTCPDGPKLMMGEVHRVGCANGRTCPGSRDRGAAPRAEYYARRQRVNDVKPRALYFCAHCARQFAHRFDIEYSEPKATA